MQYPYQKQELKNLENALNLWTEETEGKLDIDDFFFDYYDQFDIASNDNQTRKTKNALHMARLFSPFAFKPYDKDHSTFWRYIFSIGNEYLDHCSSENIMLLHDQHLDINSPESIGYIIFRQNYPRASEADLAEYNNFRWTLSLQLPETTERKAKVMLEHNFLTKDEYWSFSDWSCYETIEQLFDDFNGDL